MLSEPRAGINATTVAVVRRAGGQWIFRHAGLFFLALFIGALFAF